MKNKIKIILWEVQGNIHFSIEKLKTKSEQKIKCIFKDRIFSIFYYYLLTVEGFFFYGNFVYFFVAENIPLGYLWNFEHVSVSNTNDWNDF